MSARVRALPRHGFWTVLELPRVAYPEALAFQHRLLARRLDGTLSDDAVVVLEHFPVFTLGRRGGSEHLKVSQEFLEARGIAVIPAERGGNITYHGPGQLILYPIVDLQRHRLAVTDYVARLEEVMIRLAARWGVHAERRPENRGVWVGAKKLGSVGIAVRKHIAFHGLAFNAAVDLTPFSWIDPCGLSGVQMTSLSRETGNPVSMARIRADAKRCIETVFGVALNAGDPGAFLEPKPHVSSNPYPKAPLDPDPASARA